MRVPFNQPVIFDESLSFLKEALDNRHLVGLGPFTKKVEEGLKNLTGSENLITTSASHALEMMALLLNIEPGDEIIMPSFTFVSTANAFLLRGARLRFADNDDTGNLKLSEVARLLNKKTKAVMTVHYAGFSAQMDELKKLCAEAKVDLLEDAAQAIHSNFHGKALGTLGRLGCFSFHETKNIGSGEGGALIVNSPQDLERAEILREKGTNRKRFFMGLVDKYTWVDVGSSYVLSDLSVAFLYPQLQKIKHITERRLQIQDRYRAELKDLVPRCGAQILPSPSWNDRGNGHLFALVFEKPEMRTRFIEAMKSKEISCPFHYVSLHTSPIGQKLEGGKPDYLPGCDRLSQGLVRFPLFYNMTEDQVGYTIDSARQWILQQ